MQSLYEMADTTAAPLAALRDMAVGAFAHIQTTAMSRAQEVAENWESMSAWRRAAYRAGSFVLSAAGATIAVQALRTTGVAAHGLEASGLDGLPHFNTSQQAAAPVPHYVSAPLTQAVTVESFTPRLAAVEAPLLSADEFSLPVDLDKAPAPLELGAYRAQSGEGTIWNQTIAYADELGFGRLSEQQKHVLTGKILAYNHLSWNDARHLPPDYKPSMPTQRTMQQWLDQTQATRTHVADRPAVVPPNLDGIDGGHPNTRNPGAPGDGAPVTVVGPPGDRNCDGTPDWWPLHAPSWWPIRDDTPNNNCNLHWGWDDTAKAVALAGVLGVAYAGQRALDRRGRERQLRREAAAAEANERVINPDEAAALRTSAVKPAAPRSRRLFAMDNLRERMRLDRIHLSPRRRRRDNIGS